jgi:hypothetical protein
MLRLKVSSLIATAIGTLRGLQTTWLKYTHIVITGSLMGAF